LRSLAAEYPLRLRPIKAGRICRQRLSGPCHADCRPARLAGEVPRHTPLAKAGRQNFATSARLDVRRMARPSDELDLHGAPYQEPRGIASLALRRGRIVHRSRNWRMRALWSWFMTQRSYLWNRRDLRMWEITCGRVICLSIPLYSSCNSQPTLISRVLRAKESISLVSCSWE